MSTNSGPPIKRKRQGRRNNDQIEYLVDYMLQHPNLASGKFFKMNSRDALQGSWEELVKELNEMRSNGQSEKNVKSWKESWRDQKTKTSKKVSALRSARVETGNKKNNLPQLSDLDTKVLSIIGNDYVAGTSCPESWPEEQENNVQRMALGDESIYLAEPRSLNVGIDEENINQGDNIDADLENIEYETISCSFINENDISTAHIASQLIDKVTNDRKVTSSKRPRMVKQKLSAQLQTARNSFNGIAEKQADAMTLMADSLSVIGKALNTMADNDAKRNENDMKMIALYDKILQKL